MSQVVVPAAGTPPVADHAPAGHDVAHPDPSERALLDFFATLQQSRIPFWVIDGYGGGTFDPVDIDVLVPRGALPHQIATALHAARKQIGATLISWDRDNQFVLACGDRRQDGRSRGVGPKFVRIHLRPDYRRVGRFFYDGDEVLAAQPPRAAGDAEAFARPVSPREFGCYLVEKIAKLCLAPVHERVLSQAFQNDPDGCTKEVARFWSPANVALIEGAARAGNWEVVRRAQPELRRELRRGAFARRPLWTIRYKLSKGVRRVAEFFRPSAGLHVVMLGPDGVGKSTVVERLQRDLADAFCGIEYATFAPGLIPRKPPPEGAGGQPHGKPPRSLPASIVKGLWWVVYYSIGYHFAIRPILGRGGLALNHRYCADALVDPRRYRYKGPRWLLALAWRLARKPDLVFLLDAPPEVVQARKKEVAFEETVRQRDAYRRLVEPMPNGHVIDSAQRIEDVVADVERVIFRFMADRTARRMGLTDAAPAPQSEPARRAGGEDDDAAESSVGAAP